MSGFSLFHKAFIATRRQIGVSVLYLVVITFILAIILWLAESRVQDDFSFWDGLLWPFVKYVGDPAEIGDAPLTVVGKIIGTLVGVLGVAIFAVPAGLVGSGLIDAMDEEKRDNELQELRSRIRKAFLRDNNKVLSNYLQKHPDEKLGKDDLYFVPQEIPVYKMQARQNMDLKDIIDCCKEFPEIRLKNVAQAKAEADARFVVEYVPLTKDIRYGCFIPRQSRVTIVSTSSYAEKGTGWFAYYLAKLGGFNFLSKDLEVDYDDQDPYFNMNAEPLHDMKNQKWHEGQGNREAIEKIKKKQEYRVAFINDLTKCCEGEHSWVIIIKHHLKSTADNHDFHFNCAKKDGKECTVSDLQTYEQLIANFTQTMAHEEVAGEELGLTTTSASPLYPLKHNERQKNLAYFIRERKPQANVFVLRPASDVMNLDERKLVIAYRMAQLISQHLDNGQGPKENDVKDLQQLDFAFTEAEKNATDN